MYMPLGNPQPVRLPPEIEAIVRAQAKKEGVGYTTKLRMIIIKAVSGEKLSISDSSNQK